MRRFSATSQSVSGNPPSTTKRPLTALQRHQIQSGRSKASRSYGTTHHLRDRVRPCQSPNEQASKVQMNRVSTRGPRARWPCWYGCLRTYRVAREEPERHQLNRKRDPSFREKRNRQRTARTARKEPERQTLKLHFTTFWTGKSSSASSDSR